MPQRTSLPRGNTQLPLGMFYCAKEWKPGFLVTLTFRADNWQDFTIQTSIHSLFVDSAGSPRIRLDTKGLRDAS